MLAFESRKYATIIFVFTLAMQAVRIESLNIDLAVIIHECSICWVDELRAINKTVGDEIPKVFPMGDDKTRVAVVANAKDKTAFKWHVYTNLTGDQAYLKKSLADVQGMSSLEPGYRRQSELVTPFYYVREEIFKGEPTRPRVVLLVTAHHFDEHRFLRVDEIGKQMAESGIFVFVVWQEWTHPNRENIKREATADLTKLVGGSDESIKILTPDGKITNEFNAALIETWFKTEVAKRACVYEEKCFYADQSRSKCEKRHFTPNVPIVGGDCAALVPAPPVATDSTCASGEECKKTCDEMWKWSGPEPDCEICGEKGQVEREGEFKWKQLEHCPKVFECPTCPPTPPPPPPPPPPTPPPPESTAATSIKPKKSTKAKAIKPTTESPNIGLYVGLGTAVFVVVVVVLIIVAVVVLAKRKAAGTKATKGSSIGKKKSSKSKKGDVELGGGDGEAEAPDEKTPISSSKGKGKKAGAAKSAAVVGSSEKDIKLVSMTMLPGAKGGAGIDASSVQSKAKSMTTMPAKSTTTMPAPKSATAMPVKSTTTMPAQSKTSVPVKSMTTMPETKK